MKAYILLMFLMSGLLVGCTSTQKGTGIGAATGAAVGAIIGHQSGNRDKGALIGAAVGGAGGYAVGKKMQGKFCPVDGQKFDNSVSYCPTHGVELNSSK